MAESVGLQLMIFPNLYLKNTYINMGAVLSAPYPFIILVSSRGGGKTYGTLEACIKHDIRFIYFRRTQRILDLISDPALHPFKKINSNNHWHIYPEKLKGLVKFVDDDTKELKGYAAALSTFANVRGFDGSDIDLLIFDEFIPEPNERITFNMFSALANSIETINRNREVEGGRPLKVLLLSNSDLIYGDIVEGFKIGDDLLSMQESGEEVVEKSKDMLLLMPTCEDFKDHKRDTALYRVTAGTEFSRVALDNKFKIHDRENLRKVSLMEYKPVASIAKICIYRHKIMPVYYVSEKISGAPKIYDDTEIDIKRFIKDNPRIWRAYDRKKIIFESVQAQSTFKRLFE